MPVDAPEPTAGLMQTERLTLGVLLFGVAALALSDFVSPAYWLLTAVAGLMRLFIGPRLALTEMQASLLGWAGFFWVGAELALGRAWLVALTDFLLILSVAVSIEVATPRNHLHRLLTGTFLILAASVLTDSVLYALPLAGFLLMLWRSCRRLYAVEGRSGPAANNGAELALGGWRKDWLALFLMMLVSACLFVLAPRFDVQSGLKNIQPRLQVSGFSDSVHLGDFARELDSTVVMRVELPGVSDEQARELLQGRYWRGVALSAFDQGNWRQQVDAIRVHAAAHTSLELNSRPSDRVILLYREAVEHAFVMLPDGALRLLDLPQDAGLTENGSVTFIASPSSRLRLAIAIDAHSGIPQAGLRSEMRPPTAAEREPAESRIVRDWAQQVSAGSGNDAQRLQRVADELAGWGYSLTTRVDEAHPVEHFLLQSRSGHCEMFATSMALAARSLGIPARVVNGYYGGEWNAAGGFLMLRQQHAHAWVEAWLDHRWQRFDPTPVSRWQLSAVRFPGIEQAWDALRLGWYRYVLEFGNQDRQGLLQRIQQWTKQYAIYLLILPLGWLIGLLLRFVLPVLSLDYSQDRTARRTQRCRRLLDGWLLSHGIRRSPWQPLSRLPCPEGVDVLRWKAFVTAWESAVYADGAGWNAARMRRHLRALARMSC